MEENFKFKGWTVLWSAVGIQFVSGILYIWSIVGKALINQYHWTGTQASLPYTVATVMFVVAMVLGGRLQDLKGPRVCTTLGGIFLGIGLILSGCVKLPLLMVLTFGVILGGGIGLNNVATTASAVKWFPPEKKGLITGIVVAGVGFASVFYSPTVNYLTGILGIARTFYLLGATVLVAAVFLAQYIADPPERYKPKTNGSALITAGQQAVTGNDLAWRELIKNGVFYKLWLMLTCASAAGLMLIGHLASIVKLQAGWEGGYLLVALLAVFNTLGRLLGGSFSDKIGRINLMRLAFFLQAINLAFFGRMNSIATLTLGVILAGLCYGATFAVFPPAIADYFGMKNFGANYGLIFTGWGIGGIIGPLTAGKIFDVTGNFQAAFMVAFCLLIIAGMITFSFKSSNPVRSVF
jgi:OFA family oxalate/formate antiporter-like MFS transporter